MHTKFWFENLRHSIIMDHREVGWKGVDWIPLSQHGDQWRAVVNMLMKLWVP
jgi:hypothetical protein